MEAEDQTDGDAVSEGGNGAQEVSHQTCATGPEEGALHPQLGWWAGDPLPHLRAVSRALRFCLEQAIRPSESSSHKYAVLFARSKNMKGSEERYLLRQNTTCMFYYCVVPFMCLDLVL